MKLPEGKIFKLMLALKLALQNPAKFSKSTKRGFDNFYRDLLYEHSGIPTVSLGDIVAPEVEVKFRDFLTRHGKLSAHKIFVISTIVAHEKPRIIFEIGTFDGTSTLQLALNSPENAIVYTLDFPPDANSTEFSIDAGDRKYIEASSSISRKYTKYEIGKKVVQKLGDSANFPFEEVTCNGCPDFIFLDGSHSYDYIKNDTEKSLEILAPNGCLVWDDYTPFWPGVFEYLTELGRELPIKRIEGTRLVYYKA